MDECKPLLLGMTFVTMLFAVLGFLSPANRGGLMTAMLLLFVLMGRGLHSSTSQLNMSRVCHKKTPYTPYTPPNTPLTRATEPLLATPIPDKNAQVELKSGRV